MSEGNFWHTDKTLCVLKSIEEKVDIILALVQIDQDVLDSFGAALAAIVTALTAELQNPVVQQLPAANVDAINAQIQALQALEVPASTPTA